MTQGPPGAATDPEAVWATIAGYQFYWAAVAGVQLGVFDALAKSPASAAELAANAGCTAARMRGLADVLTASGMVVRGPLDEYRISETARAFLVSGAERSMTDLLLRSPGPWQNWPQLASTLQGAEPPVPADGAFYAALVRATFPTQYAAAKVLASNIPAATSVLDLGAGAAPWSIAILEAFPAAIAKVVDLPEVLPAAEVAIAAHGLGSRFDMVAGDYWAVPLEAEAFDVVVLGHVLRGEGDRAPALVRRAAEAMAPGGLLVVADYFVDDDRTGPVNSLLLGLTMMSATTGGRTFTRSEHRSWFEEAGLTGVDGIQLTPGQEVMTARKPGPASSATSRKTEEAP